MERVKGIEPSSQAWEAHVLPLNHTRETLCSTGNTRANTRQGKRCSPRWRTTVLYLGMKSSVRNGNSCNYGGTSGRKTGFIPSLEPHQLAPPPCRSGECCRFGNHSPACASCWDLARTAAKNLY